MTPAGVGGAAEPPDVANGASGASAEPDIAQPAPQLGLTKAAKFKGALRIDVSVPDAQSAPSPVAAMVSPLGHYATRKLPANTHRTHPVSLFAPGGDHTNADAHSLPFLEYGMVVSIVCDDRGGVVASEGFASKTVRLEKLNFGDMAGSSMKLGLGGREERKLFASGCFRLLSCPFRDCLFEVVPKMAYEATMALNATHAEGEPSPKHVAADLRFKSAAELRLNAMMYKKLYGSHVNYGHTIQLRHVKTGKYLSLDSSSIRIRGSEHVPVLLDDGSPRSHLVVLPRFKLRSRGAPVQLTDQILLTSASDVQPFNLYVSNRNITDGDSARVVGSVTHSSQWRIVRYDSNGLEQLGVSDSERSRTSGDRRLHTGSCVRFLHLESSSWLRFCQSEETAFSAGKVALQYYGDREPGEDLGGDVSVDSLWEIERPTVYEGGVIKWNDSLTFRHVLTGKYLAVSARAVSPISPSSSLRSPLGNQYATEIIPRTVAQDFPQTFRFVATALADDDAEVEDGDVVLLQNHQTKGFIHSVETHASTMMDIRFSSQPLSNSDGTKDDGALFTLVSLPGVRDEDAFKVIAVSPAETNDTLLLVSYKPILVSYLAQFRVTAAADRGQDHSQRQFATFDESTMTCFDNTKNAVNELIDFCARERKNSAEHLRGRQDLFRTHHYIELLVDMMKAPFKKYGGPFDLDEVSRHNPEFSKMRQFFIEDLAERKRDYEDEALGYISSSFARGLREQKANSMRTRGSRRGFTRGPSQYPRSSDKRSSVSSRSEFFATSMQTLTEIIAATNILLVHIFRGNRENELCIIRSGLPILMELLGNGFQTSLSLSYLLRENRNLVESMTGYASIIRNFFELIKSRGKSIRFMQFLVAMCTSRGCGVPKTQEAICDLLFSAANGYRDHVIIPLRPSPTGFDIFVPIASNSRGLAINVEAMFNKLSSTHGVKRSGGGEWMSLSSFYEAYHVRCEYRSLGRYCYGLFRLYVSLCLDRNYVSIEYVQSIFPRDQLLYSAMDSSLPRSLRAIMIDLLRVAYVDCEPQKVMTCPNYTRVWSEASVSSAESLSSLLEKNYSRPDAAFFSSITKFCLLYLRRQSGIIAIDVTPENELTLSVLRLTLKLVEFGMFLTDEEMKQLVSSLFDMLDERTDIVGAGESTAPEHQPTIRDVASTFDLSLESSSTSSASQMGSTKGARDQTLRVMPAPNPSATDCDSISSASPPLLRMHDSVILDDTSSMPISQIKTGRDESQQYYTQLPVFTPNHASPVLHNKRARDRACNNMHQANNSLLPDSDASRRALQSTQHKMSDANRIVMDIKDKICAILQHVDRIRQDFLISMFLESFQVTVFGMPPRSPYLTSEDGNDVPIFSDLLRLGQDGRASIRAAVRYPPPSPGRFHSFGNTTGMSPLARHMGNLQSLDCKYSFAQLAGRQVTTILMQMLMYEYPPLVSKSLDLLLREYNRHADLLKELENIQLLVTEDTIAIYNQLKDEVDELRRLAETTEVWMDLTSKSDYEKAECTCKLLKSLTDLIRQGDTTAIQGDNEIPNIHDRGSKPHNGNEVGSPSQKVVATSPTRKLTRPPSQYQLSPSLGRVSRLSVCHSILSFRESSASFSVDGDNHGDDRDRNPVVSIEARRLLRNLRAAEFVVNMLLDGAHFFEGHVLGYDVQMAELDGLVSPNTKRLRQARQRDQIRAVFAHCMHFLAEFCAQDPENQQLLAPHATMIAQYIHELEVAQELLVAIYSNNTQLYKTVPTELVNMFVTQLIKEGPDPRYLLFLETLTVCNEQPMFENQLLVMFQLVKAVESAAVLQLFDDNAVTIAMLSELMRRYSLLVRGETAIISEADCSRLGDNHRTTGTSSSPLTRALHAGVIHQKGFLAAARDITSVSKIIEYHTRLLHLFAACATGKNTRVQEICQQIVPLSVILDLLGDVHCTEGMQVAVFRYMNQVFLVADEIETPNDEVLFRILTAISTICEVRVLQYLRDMQQRSANQSTATPLRKKYTKRGKLFTKFKATTPLESSPLYVVIHAVSPILLSFFEQFPHMLEPIQEHDRDALRRLQHSFALLFTTCSARTWNLSRDIAATLDELVYIIDKSIIGLGEQEDLSVEGLWASSLLSDQQVDLTKLNLSMKLIEILEAALREEQQFPRPASNRNLLGEEPSVLEISGEPFVSIVEKDGAEPRADRRDMAAAAVSVPGRASQYLLTLSDTGKRSEMQPASTSLSEPLRVAQPLVVSRGNSTDCVNPESNSTNHVGMPSDLRERRHSGAKLKEEQQIAGDATGSAISPSKRRRWKLQDILPVQLAAQLKRSHQCQPHIADKVMATTGDHIQFNGGALVQDVFSAPSPSKGDRTGSWTKCVSSEQVVHQFDQFLKTFRRDPQVSETIRGELNHMVLGILGVEALLRSEFDTQRHLCDVHLTFDLVVRKLVAHVATFQDPSYLKMNMTLLDVFCRMIYGIQDPAKRHKMQITLNQLGVTRLVVQLIAGRDDDALFDSSIEVGVALLDGMNAKVQEAFYAYWCDASNIMFFERIQSQIEKVCALIPSDDRDKPGILRRGVSSPTLKAKDDPIVLSPSSPMRKRKRYLRAPPRLKRFDTKSRGVLKPSVALIGANTEENAGPSNTSKAPVTSIFRFLQLLCEGHYLNAQRSLIVQPHLSNMSVNLVEVTTSFLLNSYLGLANTDVELIIQLFETITEFCQGPCEEAQETVVNYKFISAVNTLLADSPELVARVSVDAVRQMRASIIVTLLSLLEGRSDLVIHGQLVQELNFDALKACLVDVYAHFLKSHRVYPGNLACSNDFYLTMGFNVYILLQQLADRHPHMAHWIPSVLNSHRQSKMDRTRTLLPADSNDLVPEYRDAFMFFQLNCVKVEVIWDHHRSPREKSDNNSSVASVGSVYSSSVAEDDAHSLNHGASNAGATANHAAPLIPFYFPLHPICFSLTDQSKKKLVWQVARDSDKLSDFFQRSDKLVDEMAHQHLLQRYATIGWFAGCSDPLKRVSFVLAIVINLIVLLFFRANGPKSRPYPDSRVQLHLTSNPHDKSSVAVHAVLKIAGSLQLILCCLSMLCYLLNSAPLLVKKGWKRHIQTEQEKLSKIAASEQRSSVDVDDRGSFEDTEQLLRSLRGREEEYDYFFLPRSVQELGTYRKAASGSEVMLRTADYEGASEEPSGIVRTTFWARSRYMRRRVWMVGKSLYFLAQNPRVLYHVWQIVIAILGSCVIELFFAFHLLDIVNRYQDLNNVLRSIARPAKVLGLTALLYLIVVYVFSIVGFYFFREDYTPLTNLTDGQLSGEEPYPCQQLFQCFLVSLDQSFKANGGLGGYLKQQTLGENGHSYGRFAFDLLYNTILMIMLLNILFGVIIDTFASLREADSDKVSDMHSRCFICSIDAYTFDSATKRGFHDHIYVDHNMWNYLFLFVHIRKKRITDYNGLELFLAMRMAKKDVSFFPVHRALVLDRSSAASGGGSNGADSRGREGVKSDHGLDTESGRLEAATDDQFTGGRVRSASVATSYFSSSGLPSTTNYALARRMQADGRKGTRTAKRQASGRLGAGAGSNALRGGSDGTLSAQRATNEKLEKLESTIESLVATQSEMREELQRSADRQCALVETLASLQLQLSAAMARPSPSDTDATDDSRPAMSEMPSPAAPRRRARSLSRQPPSVFNFDAVGD